MLEVYYRKYSKLPMRPLRVNRLSPHLLNWIHQE